jgi:hypothetical protein
VETLKNPGLYSPRQVRHAYLTLYTLENACGHPRRLIITQPPEHDERRV